MAEESAVKVCVRVRPLIPREDSAASENAEPVHYFWKADAKSIYQVDDGNSSKSFSFDRVFTAEETTNQLYQAIAKPLVVSSVQGYNGTIFAYGQTASGKTFTMLGSDRFPGVIPLAVEDVFQTIKSCPKKEFLLRVSYMEIYNETVSDLLVDSWKRQPLEVRETINKTIYVADLREELVTSLAQVLAWIRKGEKNRHYGKTKMNERSSRSHAIFRMILESRERSDPASGENADGAIIVSHLNLVDLAGSERASQTGADGTRFKEGCNINRSLFTLGHVIKKLTDEGQKGFTNYRDSKLTRILQNSLGGNAKTVIICTITPVTLEETLSTLQFASTAKKMKNDPHVTEVSDEGALLKRYRNEIEDLKRRLQEVSSVTQTTAKEKKSLSQRLQEKDQLQTEQEDRIRNLTKLLVTSSNLVPVQKVPKRRETWGGKMQGLARTSRCDSFTGNRKADLSCLSELCESDKDFDAHWEIPDEPSDEMDMNQTSVTVRSFADSPKDFLSPDRMHELSERVSILMMQLEMETQQKKDALDKLQSTEQRAAQLELELQMEAEQKVKALEQVEILGGRLADIGSQNEDQSNTQDMVLAERDYLKQELGMVIEQIGILEEEKAFLSQELEEKRELDEFKALEDECRKDHEAVETQIILQSLQDEMQQQRTKHSDLVKLYEQKESVLGEHMLSLSQELESVRAEKETLLSEQSAAAQSSAEEMEKLLSAVTSLTAEIDQLQGDLQENVDMVSGTKEKLSEQEQLNSQLREQAERREQETQLQQRLLSDAITTMSVPREQLSSLDQSNSRVKETMTSQLQESTEQLQESFGKFQHFIDACSKYNTTGPVTVERCQFALTKAATQTYNCVYRLQQQAAQFVSKTMEHLKLQAQSYMKVFKELVRKDLASFEERRALDELLCRVKAQTSVKDKDFHSLWDNQLTELLDKRQLYLQKMSSILGKLWACIASYPSELSTDNTDRECFKEKLQSLFSKPMNFFLMDSILSTNLVYLSELVHSRKMTLKGIVDEQDSLLGVLKLLEAQAEAQLTEERSKITCLLVLQLKQTQDKVKDSLAQVEEKEHAIQTLRSKLRESERKAPPSVVEVEWTSASDKQEMQMMNTVLTEKDHSMRKLKQTLRSQQQGEESFLQGEDLHARLTNPRGLVIKSSVQLEKTKLEEEVKRLCLKVTELERFFDVGGNSELLSRSRPTQFF